MERSVTLFFIVYLAPLAVVIAMWPGSSAGAQDVPAMLGVGLGGYAGLFVLFVFVVPRLLRRLGRAEVARRWKCGAFHASLGSSVFVIGSTIANVPLGSVGVRLLLGSAASLVVYLGLLRAKERYFDRLCGWPRWSWRRKR
jgi:hypothetical protein